MELEGEINHKQHIPCEPDLWGLDLEELESIVEKENNLKEKQLHLIRNSLEECTVKKNLLEHRLRSLEADIENCCNEIRIKQKQLVSVQANLQLTCRDVEIKEKEYEEFERRLEECRREIKEKEDQVKFLRSSICDHDRRLRLKQEDCTWYMEMLQKLTVEKDEVQRKLNIEIDERQKEIEEKVARLSVIEDLIKDREIELNAFDMQFHQSLDESEKLLRDNEKLLSDQLAKRDEYSKEIKMKEEELGTIEKLIDTMGKKYDSMKAMREKIIHLMQEVKSNTKNNDLMKEMKLELEKKEAEFQEVVKKLELSKADNELLIERNFEAKTREKRLVEDMKHIEASNKKCGKLLMEYEIKEKQFKEQMVKVELREKECDKRMNSLCSKEKHFKARFKEFEINEKKFEERTKELGLKEKELEEKTRELESKEKKHKEETEELKSEVIQFECNRKKFLSEQEHVNLLAMQQESEKDKFEAQMREHELKEKEYEVRVQNLFSKEKKFEIQMKQLKLKEKEYEGRVQELSSKEKKFEIQMKQLKVKEKKYEERLKGSASKGKQHVSQHSQTPQALDNESSPATGGGNLQLVLNEQTNEPELYVNTILVELQSTSDPAKLVLDVIQKPIIEDKGAIIEERHIFLLEQLMKISPEIKCHVRERAMKLALDLKAKINMGANTENSLVVLGFLLVLSAYGLVTSFDKDEVFKQFEFAAQHRQTVELFRTLGFVDKISDFVQNLINKERIIEAVRFICAYELADKFRPVHLLNQHLQKQRQPYKKSIRGMPPSKNKVEVLEKEIGILKTFLESMLDNNIGSKNQIRDIGDRINKLTKQKEDLILSLAAQKPQSKDEQVQQQQQKQTQQPKGKKRGNEKTNSHPSQDINPTKRPKVATPAPPPPPPPPLARPPPPVPPQPPIFHPQFHQRHVFNPWCGRENGVAPPRPRGFMPGQFNYYTHAASPIGVGRFGDHAGSNHFYRPGPYPPPHI